MTYFRPKKDKPVYIILLNFIGNVFFVYSIIVALALITFSAVTIECEVFGSSMQPSLNQTGGNRHDTVYVNKFDREFGYGDIVVVKYQGYQDPIIKRVVGMAGDKIDIIQDTDGFFKLKRNGQVIQEEYIFVSERVSTPTYFQNGMNKTFANWGEQQATNPERFNIDGTMTVPNGCIFALGDNRAVSVDSSVLGYFDIESVSGKVEIIRYYGKSEIAFYWDYLVTGKFFVTLKNMF